MRMRNLTLVVLALGVAAAVGVTVAGCDRSEDNGLDIQIGTTNPVEEAANTGRPLPRAARPPRADGSPDLSLPLTDAFKDHEGAVGPDKNVAMVIQTVAAFDHPMSCAVSLDRKYLFVTNSSKIQAGGFRHNKGSISKLEILPDGRLKMIKPDWVTNLHAPMGIAALPIGTPGIAPSETFKGANGFPAGALFVATGTASAVDDKGEHVDDIKKYNPGVTVLDPGTGKQLGFIPMGMKHAAARVHKNRAILAPAGVCFDHQGNLFVADCAGDVGGELNPQVTENAGILRIKYAAIDAYAADQEVKFGIAFLPVRHVPMAVYHSPLDDGLYWSTCDGQGPAGGAIYRMKREEFPTQNEVGNILGDMGSIMGATITPNGTLLVARTDGDLMMMTSKVISQVRFPEDGTFASPCDIKLHRLPNGYNILYVPEQDPTSTVEGKQRLRVVLLPTRL